MVALIRRERIPLTAATSGDEYNWALRQAVNTAQDDAFLRSLPLEFDLGLLGKSPETFQQSERWDHKGEMRDLAMADNLRWVQQRESSRRGKILFFAHDGHVQTRLASRFLGRQVGHSHSCGKDPPVCTCGQRWTATWSLSALITAAVRIRPERGLGRWTPLAWTAY